MTNKDPALPGLRVLIADDHRVWTEGLSLSLEQYGIETVGIVYNGVEVVQACQAHQPDVVLLDIQLPGRDGLEVLRDIRRHLPETIVLMLTGSADPTMPRRALELGAAGFVSKSGSGGALAREIRQAFADGPPGETGGKTTASAQRRHNPVDLTPTEVRVLVFIARGLDNAAIATQMTVSENTVKTHVSNLLTKLEVPNRTLAAMWAIKHGYVG